MFFVFVCVCVALMKVKLWAFVFFTFLCVSSSLGQGLEVFNTSCPNPDGVVAPEEVQIAAMVLSESNSLSSTVILLAIDLINQDRCLLPGNSPLHLFLFFSLLFGPSGWLASCFLLFLFVLISSFRHSPQCHFRL